MLGCSILSVGAVLQFTSTGIPQMIVGRIVTGLGNGMNTSTVPVWHSECTLPKNRGKALGIELAINIFGVVSVSPGPNLSSTGGPLLTTRGI
jgi:MFS family permease